MKGFDNKRTALFAKRKRKADKRQAIKLEREIKVARYFETISSEERKYISNKGVLARISAEVRKAWSDSAQLQFRRISGEGVKDLAKEYGISVRTMYRITGGKINHTTDPMATDNIINSLT